MPDLLNIAHNSGEQRRDPGLGFSSAGTTTKTMDVHVRLNLQYENERVSRSAS